MLPRGLTLRFPSFAEVNSKIPPFRRGSSSGARLRLCVGARPSVAGQVSSSVVRGCKVSRGRAVLVFGCAQVQGLPWQDRSRLRLYVGARSPVAGQPSSSVVRRYKASLSQGRPCIRLYVCLANNGNIKLLKQGGSNFHVLPELI